MTLALEQVWGLGKGTHEGSAKGAIAVFGGREADLMSSCCEHHDGYHPYRTKLSSLVTSYTMAVCTLSASQV